MMKEEELKSLDKSQWYRCRLDKVCPQIRDFFLQCHPDEDSLAFLHNSHKRSDWLFTQLFHVLAKAVLCWFMTRTSLNGLLGRGSMFVFSHRQFTQLLDVEQSWKADLLLDIGAGDGAVTEVMSRHFRSVHVTELSPIMRRVLAGKGYKVLDAHKWMEKKELYDVISCLNVLDRCDRPLALLENMKNSLKTGTGRLILAIVLPVKQYVESGKPDNKPTEILPVEGNTFEVQVSNLYLNVIAPAGFEIVKWSRVPYLCEGDLEQSYYWLDDVVFVLKLKEDQLL
ncbi:protein-L-histidine N-pros-methyltransferase isoform X3 [Tachypleus tridentatus]|uniref:protein-L-histidine N-pros-methyltransferase isoform X3 n=1 Tax=Tachypleus tridentatus TaxID=6853 RepID=UPI003FD4CB49